MTAGALEWTFNPWRDQPGRAWLALLAAAAVATVIASLGEPAMVRIALGLAVLGGFAPALLPARCRVDEQGVSRRGPFGGARRSWSELRRGVLAPAGLLVSPYARRHWLDSHRGLLLPVPPRGRERLFAELAPRLHDHGL